MQERRKHIAAVCSSNYIRLEMKGICSLLLFFFGASLLTHKNITRSFVSFVRPFIFKVDVTSRFIQKKCVDIITGNAFNLVNVIQFLCGGSINCYKCCISTTLNLNKLFL